MKRTPICALALLAGLLMAGIASAQDAHYTYPFSIMCPAEPMPAGSRFTVELSAENAGENYKPAYNWSVSSGTIVSGQGTPMIEIESDAFGADTLHITLDRRFLEAHYPMVQKTAACSARVVRPQAVLFDEFPTVRTTCEEANARLDQFFVELSNNPIDRGLIIIYDSSQRRRAAWYREQLINNFMGFRRFDTSRITFVRGPYRNDAKTQFWRVPPGANDPELLSQDADAVPTEPEVAPTKPYLYATAHLDGLIECDVPRYDLAEYAKVLNTEPPSRGRIVIGETSRARFNREQRSIAAELARYGIARNRITFVYKYVRPNRLLEIKELWIVP